MGNRGDRPVCRGHNGTLLTDGFLLGRLNDTVSHVSPNALHTMWQAEDDQLL